jgi:hypothetical protein
MTFDDFVEKSRSIPSFAEPDGRTLFPSSCRFPLEKGAYVTLEIERLYGKDVECPQEWEEWLVKERVLPEKYLPEGSDDLFAVRPKKVCDIVSFTL